LTSSLTSTAFIDEPQYQNIESMEYEVYYIRSSGLIPSATSILCRLEANVYNLLYNITTVGDTARDRGRGRLKLEIGKSSKRSGA